MHCLKCAQDIPDAFFSEKNASPEFKGGRFSCPHCGADHIRREIGSLPSGVPVHSFRLWGHPLSPTGTPSASPAAGQERRRRPRVKPRR